ncbi:MAG TPA: hypothetical protein VIG64_01840 [Actinomycetota bacterium]
MGPLQEIRSSGGLGPNGAELLYGVVLTVAIARNFPPPVGHTKWDASAVQEVAHEFLTDGRGEKRLSDLAVRAVDEDSFKRLLHKAVLNFHRDRSRKTDFGALVRRVSEVLNSDDRFEKETGEPARWRLARGPSLPSTVPQPVLAAAASEEPNVTIPAWTSTRRRAPLADLDTFRRLCERILTAAQGSLTSVDVAHAIALRLDPGRVPLTLELDVMEGLAARADEARTESEVLGRMEAAEMFEQLDDRDRILLATWTRPVRDLSEVIGLGHSQAGVLRQRLAARIASELEGDEEGESVVLELQSLAADWMRDRTTGHGSALSRD